MGLLRRSHPFDWAALVVALALLAAITVNAVVLATDHDEGYNLVVARELAETGAYASVTAEGQRFFDPYVSTGPPAIVPAAAVFAVLGEGVTKGRLVMIGWSAVFLACYWLATRRAFGPAAGFWALAALLAILPLFARTSAQLLGESSALALSFGGLVALLVIPRERWLVRALAAGLLLGLAAMTKTLFIAGAAGLVAWYAVEWWRYRGGVRPLAVALAAFVAPLTFWWLVQVAFVGVAGAVERSLQAAGHYTSTAVTGARSGPALERSLGFADRFGWGQLLLATVAAAVSVGLGLVRPRVLPVVAFALAVSLPWWGWWLVLSPDGVLRRVMSAYIFMGPLIGAALALGGGVLVAGLRGRAARLAIAGAASAVVLAVLALPAVDWLRAVPDYRTFRDQQREAVAYLHGYGDMLRPYGVGWWMAWDVAILLERPIHDLQNWDIRRRPWIIELIILTPESREHILADESFVATMNVCCEVEYDQHGYRFYRLLIDDRE